MSSYTETFRISGGCDTSGANARRPEPRVCRFKEEWVRDYANRILQLWLRWQTPLGVARDYVEQLKDNLREFYDEPLKKKFIEGTY